ncbi:MAG: nuclear transport factor 2 family protein [Myxococcales bacterium]
MAASFEERIRARFNQGFGEWNQGYEAWLKWCHTLYEPDAHYNVYGRRLTLQQYKDMMGQFFSAFDIQLGALDNVLVQGEWGAIRYSVYVTNKKTGEKTELKTMEFVRFKDNAEPIGARVVEGWALSDKPLSTSGH